MGSSQVHKRSAFPSTPDAKVGTRDAPPERARALISAMEPDEAVDVLRDMGRDESDAILAHVAPDVARQLTVLLGYPETMAGGFMTTALATASLSATVMDARRDLVLPAWSGERSGPLAVRRQFPLAVPESQHLGGRTTTARSR
jgi:hypothetical protein